MSGTVVEEAFLKHLTCLTGSVNIFLAFLFLVRDWGLFTFVRAKS